MKNYFSSDWHLSHANILKFDKRPFKTIEEHDEAIIKNAMKRLQPGDNFYYLGDFCFKNARITEGYLQTLASSGANLYFIKGNHDGKDTIKLYKQYGTFLGQQDKVKANDQEIVLNHFKCLIWDKAHHGAWHFYGHSHGSAEKFEWGKSMDLAINIHDYQIKEFYELKPIMDSREFKTIDHHGHREYDKGKLK
jgi:calcineurin-like phosphoesterase family protein